jgi:hypothetical protein
LLSEVGTISAPEKGVLPTQSSFARHFNPDYAERVSVRIPLPL